MVALREAGKSMGGNQELQRLFESQKYIQQGLEKVAAAEPQLFKQALQQPYIKYINGKLEKETSEFENDLQKYKPK